MSLSDYFKTSEYKANAIRLETELQARKQQSQAEIKSLQVKHNALETKIREIGLLDLLAVQEQIRLEQIRLTSVQIEVATA